MRDIASGQLERLGLLTPDALERTPELLARLDEDGIETVRFVFSDQHGILRGKAVVSEATGGACRDGITAPSSLLLKDTSHRTVFPVWTKDAGFGEGRLTGAGDMLLVPNPHTYRRLPWSPHSAWVLCDLAQPDGAPISFAPRTVLRTALDRLLSHGLEMICGLEVEFHIFSITDENLRHEAGGMPGTPPDTAPLNHGYQLLSDCAYNELEGILDELRRTAVDLGLPVRSVEIEFGPSQVEFTFDPASASDHADNMVLFRTMVKQVCARHGLAATFMCRPIVDHAAASGWHLHQSIVDRQTGINRFTSDDDGLTPIARQWIAGLLDHAAECCLLTTPTVNGYHRYQPHQLAPDRIQWGRDNRGAMLRALVRAGDRASRVENRAAEPAATPHYFFASQALAGISGIERNLIPPAPSEAPYDSEAEALPASLEEAIDAFAAGTLFSDALGEEFKTYMLRLKRAEWERCQSGGADWEQREYAGIF